MQSNMRRLIQHTYYSECPLFSSPTVSAPPRVSQFSFGAVCQRRDRLAGADGCSRPRAARIGSKEEGREQVAKFDGREAEVPDGDRQHHPVDVVDRESCEHVDGNSPPGPFLFPSLPTRGSFQLRRPHWLAAPQRGCTRQPFFFIGSIGGMR